MKRIVFIGIFMTFIFSLSLPIYAQWKNVAPNLLGNLYRDGLDYNFGGALHYSDGILWAGKYELWKSIDTGKTWEITLRQSGRIMSIDFWDNKNGIVAADTESGVIYLTRDGGVSWNKLSIPLKTFFTTSAYFLGSSQIIVVNSMNGSILISRDGGNSFSNVFQTTSRIVFGKWVRDGIAYCSLVDPFKSSSLLYTDDFGNTWQQSSGFTEDDSYSFDFDKCDPSLIFWVTEEAIDSRDQTSNLYMSSDMGISWNSVASGPSDPSKAACYFVGSVVVSEGVVYVQTQTDGIHRSTNKGSSWQKIGGPNMSYDTRFLAEINKNLIFAVDSNGSIWETTNSGGDSITNNSTGANTIVTLSAPSIINDTIGATIQMPIFMTSFPKIELPECDLVMHYDTNSLVYKNSISITGRVVDISGEQYSGRTKLRFLSSDLASMTDSVIGYSVFTFFPSENTCSKVVYDSLQFTISSLSPCSTISSNDSAIGLIGSTPGCGKSTIAQFMRTGTIPEFFINPNPAENSIIVRCSQNSNNVQCILFDQLGRSVLNYGELNFVANMKMVFDVSSLPSGTYFLELTNRNLSQIRPIIVRK